MSMDVPDLIRQIENNQKVIQDYLGHLKTMVRSYSEARPSLLKLRDLVFTHLGLQNADVFELLEDAFEDRERLKLLEFLEEDLTEIKYEAINFFDAYTPDGTQGPAYGFPKDFMQFAQLLTLRIDAEKQYLVPFLKDL